MKKIASLLFLFLFGICLTATAQTVTNQVVLDASASSDPDGSITKYQWTKISGPVNGDVITNASSVKATVTYSLPGIYKYELTVTDNRGGIDRDSISVQVIEAANRGPRADAGADKIIQLPPKASAFNYDRQAVSSELLSRRRTVVY